MNPIATQTPERHEFAVQLLKAIALFGVIASISDLLVNRYLTSAEDAFFVIFSIFVLYLARASRYSSLPIISGIGLLAFMCFLAIFQLVPQHLENCVWVSIFPFAFFYLAGQRNGLILSLLSAVFIPISYAIFPSFSDAPRITPYDLLQIIGAFLLATVLAYKYEQIRLRQEVLLKHSAECDPLTGLLNRRGFSTLSHPVRQQALRSQQPFAVIMIDIDDFKKVNDTQGHNAGDLLLKEVAALLQQNTRSADIVARWGGEEFILLLPQSNLDGARTVTEKIRTEIAARPFASGSHTVSLGIAIHEQNEPLEMTINRADHAMYQAKQNGKNRVEAITLLLAQA